MDSANLELEDANTQLEASANAAEQRCADLEQEVHKLHKAQSTLKVIGPIRQHCWLLTTSDMSHTSRCVCLLHCCFTSLMYMHIGLYTPPCLALRCRYNKFSPAMICGKERSWQAGGIEEGGVCRSRRWRPEGRGMRRCSSWSRSARSCRRWRSRRSAWRSSWTPPARSRPPPASSCSRPRHGPLSLLLLRNIQCVVPAMLHGQWPALPVCCALKSP